jgi:adenylate cyclase, class 2
MHHLIVEIKARCSDPEKIRTILRARGARFAGLDHQVDTYFRVSAGRLKLREGKIENALIFYCRER